MLIIARVLVQKRTSPKRGGAIRSDVVAIIRNLLLSQSIKRIPMTSPAALERRKSLIDHRDGNIQKKFQQGQRKVPNRGVLMVET
jgi:hypothetical protein